MAMSSLVYVVLIAQLSMGVEGNKSEESTNIMSSTQLIVHHIPTSSSDQSLTATYDSVSTTKGGLVALCEPCSGFHCLEGMMIYAIIIAAAVGTILIISIVLCVISYCLWRRRMSAIHAVMKENESLPLENHEPTNGTSASPNHDAPEVAETTPLAEIGISDVENGTSHSNNTAQEETQDHPGESTLCLPPPDPSIM
ncbi:uncharacterized protein O3C94_002704 [Discoglossus pictus]